VRVVLDTTILVRANGSARGLARTLLLHIIGGRHVLLVSEEILYELARVLRYPRMQSLYGLTEADVYNYVGFLRESARTVTPNPLLNVPIRDPKDIIVVQTAVAGSADVICTKDRDFYDQALERFLKPLGIIVVDDISLMRKLRS